DGAADISIRTLREGRSTASYSVDLSQNGAPTIAAMATMGSLGELPDDVATTATPPQLPPPEECIDAAEASEEFTRPLRSSTVSTCGSTRRLPASQWGSRADAVCCKGGSVWSMGRIRTRFHC